MQKKCSCSGFNDASWVCYYCDGCSGCCKCDPDNEPPQGRDFDPSGDYFGYEPEDEWGSDDGGDSNIGG